jgi:urease accessory protein
MGSLSTNMGGTSTESGSPTTACRAAAPVASAALGTELRRLLQLSRSRCPIGAFALSQGLEQAVERRWVRDEASLSEWLLGVGRHALARLDLPLLLRAHAAWKRGDAATALDIAGQVRANREARELWEQEREQGSAFALLLTNLGVGAAAPLEDRAQSSYVVAYALGAVHFGISADLAAHGYAFAWSEQQASAAARLIPLGHMATQRVLSTVLSDVPQWVNGAARLGDEEVGSLTPGLAIAAAWHETQYSRLFRS